MQLQFSTSSQLGSARAWVCQCTTLASQCAVCVEDRPPLGNLGRVPRHRQALVLGGQPGVALWLPLADVEGGLVTSVKCAQAVHTGKLKWLRWCRSDRPLFTS